MHLVNVKYAVLNSTKIAVAQKIVLLVRIEWTGHDAPQSGSALPWPKELNDFVASDSSKDVEKFRIRLNHFGRHQFVYFFFLLLSVQFCSIGISLQSIFRNVAKRPMPDVVEQRRALDQFRVVMHAERAGHETGHVCNAERVIKACVEGAWIYEASHRKLSDSTQTLKRPCFDESGDGARQADKPVNWIANLKRHRPSTEISDRIALYEWTDWLSIESLLERMRSTLAGKRLACENLLQSSGSVGIRPVTVNNHERVCNRVHYSFSVMQYSRLTPRSKS